MISILSNLYFCTISRANSLQIQIYSSLIMFIEIQNRINKRGIIKNNEGDQKKLASPNKICIKLRIKYILSLLIIVKLQDIEMARRALALKQVPTNKLQFKKQQEIKFDWINQIESEFQKAVEKPIEIRQNLMKNSQLQRCLTHNIIFSIYCTICRKVLCASCMYTNLIHRKHRVVPIQSANEEIKEDIKTFDSKIPQILQLADGVMKLNSSFLVQIQRQYNPIVIKIQDFYESLKQLIKVKEKQQLKFLKQKREMIRNEITSYNKELARISQYVEEKYKSYANTNIKAQMLIPSRNILQNLLAATNFVNESTLDLQKFKFPVQVDNIVSNKSTIAHIISNLVSAFQQNPINSKVIAKSKERKVYGKPLTPTNKKKVQNLSLGKRQNSSVAGFRTYRKI